MCFPGKGGIGGLFGKGGLGGLLGGLGGGLLDFAFPEAGVPLSLATGGGGFLGNLLGGGDVKGAALEGLTTGAAGGLGELASGGSFFGAPGGSGISGLFGGGGGAGATTAAATDVAPTTAAASAGVPGAVTQLASAAGTGPTDLTTGLTAGGTTAPAVTGNAVGTAAGVPSTVTGGISDFGSAFNQAIPAGSDAGASIGSKILDYIKQNPLAALTVGAAAYPLLRGNTTPGLPALQSEANLLATQGNQEAQALSTGQLPQGAQAALDNAAAAAKAQIRSQYGQMGLTGSTLEADKLASIDSHVAEQKFGMLKDVTQSGLDALGKANPLLEKIMETEISQDKATSDAVAKLAAALAGAGSGATTKAVA